MNSRAASNRWRHLAVALVGVGSLASAACTDLPMPPELANPQILGVRAANPAVPAGERTALDLLLAGPEGIAEPEAIEWAVVSLDERAPALGSIEIVDDQVFYVAPAEVDDVALATIEVTVTAGGRVLEAVKGIAVGTPVATENPVINEVRIDGDVAPPGTRLEMTPEEVASLDMSVSPDPGDEADYAWYSNVAEINLYRRIPSELVASEDPGEGVLIAVYRDGLGGIDWTSFDLTVAP